MREADVGLQFADTIKLGFSGSNFRQREPAAPEYPPNKNPPRVVVGRSGFQ